MDRRGFDAQQQPYCSRQVVAMSRDRHAGQLTPVMPVGGLIGRNVIPIDRLVDPSHSLTHQPDQAGIFHPDAWEIDGFRICVHRSAPADRNPRCISHLGRVHPRKLFDHRCLCVHPRAPISQKVP